VPSASNATSSEPALRRRRVNGARFWAPLALVLAAGGACATVIPLEPALVPVPATAGAPPLEIVVSLAGGPYRVPVQNTFFAYDGLTEATRRYVAAATAPWATRHAHARPGGWEMAVEITRANAWAHVGGRMGVELETRVTLRGIVGRLHLGQTTGYCQVAGALGDDAGVSVVYECLERMGRDLAGWLEGIEP
jgi:hypothetical protein